MGIPGRRKGLILLVILGLAVWMPQCCCEDGAGLLQGRYGKRQKTVEKKVINVGKFRNWRPRRGVKIPGRFVREVETADDEAELIVSPPHVFQKRTSARDHRAFRMPTRILRSVADEGPKVAKAWPSEFSISFKTKAGATKGVLAYDWINQSLVVHHDAKSTFCLAQGTSEACQMLENSHGTYLYIPSQSRCRMISDASSLTPEWTVKSLFLRTEHVPGVGMCRIYEYPPTGYEWAETVVGGFPCMLAFPDPAMAYVFDPSTYIVGTPEEKYFDFPDYCFTPIGAAEIQ